MDEEQHAAINSLLKLKPRVKKERYFGTCHDYLPCCQKSRIPNLICTDIMRENSINNVGLLNTVRCSQPSVTIPGVVNDDGCLC